MMGGRLLLVVLVSLLAAEEGATFHQPIPSFPEGEELFFDLDPSDPLYSEVFGEERQVTPMIPEEVKPEGGRSDTPASAKRSAVAVDGESRTLSHPDCGNHNLRIVNGEEATPNEYPWQVRTVTIWSDRRGGSCGGSIINEQWILTAAHCVVRSTIPVKRIKISVGTHLRRNPGAHGGYKVDGAIPPVPHSDYSFPSHDIALVKLKTSLTFTQTVGPVCLPPRSWANDDFVGRDITLSGWGLTESGSASLYLKHAQTTGYPSASCAAMYGPAVDSTVLCTDGSDVQKVCSGDSGGPVTLSDNGRVYLVGAISFTGGCKSTRPDGHARVAKLIDWIVSKTGINF